MILFNDILFASRYMKRQDRVFLMDGDALIIPQKRLLWILERIREHLPWVKRVGTYANTKCINMKSPEELAELREKGLGILFLGVETGDDEIRKKIRGNTRLRSHPVRDLVPTIPGRGFQWFRAGTIGVRC